MSYGVLKILPLLADPMHLSPEFPGALAIWSNFHTNADYGPPRSTTLRQGENIFASCKLQNTKQAQQAQQATLLWLYYCPSKINYGVRRMRQQQVVCLKNGPYFFSPEILRLYHFPEQGPLSCVIRVRPNPWKRGTTHDKHE